MADRALDHRSLARSSRSAVRSARGPRTRSTTFATRSACSSRSTGDSSAPAASSRRSLRSALSAIATTVLARRVVCRLGELLSAHRAAPIHRPAARLEQAGVDLRVPEEAEPDLPAIAALPLGSRSVGEEPELERRRRHRSESHGIRGREEPVAGCGAGLHAVKRTPVPLNERRPDEGASLERDGGTTSAQSGVYDGARPLLAAPAASTRARSSVADGPMPTRSASISNDLLTLR